MPVASLCQKIGGIIIVGIVVSPSWGENWPQWRGPAGDGVSRETNLSSKWNEQEGVIWKCSLPGWGASTPAIWSDSIFLTTQEADNLLLLKINKTTGRIDWTRQVGTGTVNRIPLGPKSKQQRKEQKFHKQHNMASPSPVTDGELVIAHYGNGDTAAYDFAGNQLWKRNLQQDYGNYTIWWGHANSPVLYQDLVISVCMQDSLADLQEKPVESYLVAHDKRTGKERWKTLRMTQAAAEKCDSYTTPIFYQHENQVDLIVVGGDQVDAYEPNTGKKLWYLAGLARGRTITGPTLGHGLVFATEGFRGSLYAIGLGGKGPLTEADVAWKQSQGTADSSCPVIWKDLIFWITDNGVAHCHDAKTGSAKWERRLAGDFKASPIAAAGRIYFLNLAGKCTVVAAAPEFQKLAENEIDEETIASPAISDGKIFLRGKKTLYCLGNK
jgi:outer membrane protein assembly factor BamB